MLGKELDFKDGGVTITSTLWQGIQKSKSVAIQLKFWIFKSLF